MTQLDLGDGLSESGHGRGSRRNQKSLGEKNVALTTERGKQTYAF